MPIWLPTTPSINMRGGLTHEVNQEVKQCSHQPCNPVVLHTETQLNSELEIACEFALNTQNKSALPIWVPWIQICMINFKTQLYINNCEQLPSVSFSNCVPRFFLKVFSYWLNTGTTHTWILLNIGLWQTGPKGIKYIEHQKKITPTQCEWWLVNKYSMS